MRQRPTRYRYLALLGLTLAAALAYLSRNPTGVAESTIREDLHLTLDQSSWFLGAFFWSYAIFQIPSGWFSQRVGTRAAMTCFALAWSLATLGIGLANHFWLLVLAQLIMGIAQAGLCPAATVSLGRWFPNAERSLACGAFTAAMQLGAIVTGALTGYLLTEMSWRWVFALFSIPGIVWAIWFHWSFRNEPEEMPGISKDELTVIHGDRDAETRSTSETGQAITLKTGKGTSRVLAVLFLCGQQICRNSGYIFFATWFPTFLQKTRGISVESSGYLQGLVLAGTLIGSLLGGAITDWVWRRTGSLRMSRSGVGAGALGACGLLILAAWVAEDVVLSAAFLSLGSLSAALAGPPTFSAVIDIGGTRIPQLMGLINMCGNLSAAISTVIIGAIFARIEDWNLILLLFSAIYLLGGVFWALVKPKPHQPAPITNNELPSILATEGIENEALNWSTGGA